MKDLIVIGAGPGGYDVAMVAKKKGLDVLLINGDKLGGTCLNYGCIPTKTYHKNASLIKDLKEAEIYGLKNLSYSFNYLEVKNRKEKVVNTLKDGINFLLNKLEIEVVNGYATFKNDNTIVVNGVEYQAKNFIIATGSKDRQLSTFPDALNSDDMLDLDILPEKLVIIGGGVIGIEYASIYNQFGIDIEVVEFMDRIVPTIDSDLSKRLLSYLKRQKIKFHLSSKALYKDDEFVYIEEKGKIVKIPYDKVLVSIGRVANYQGLSLENCHVEYDKRGIITDDNFQTSNPNIYAVGDVTGKNMLAHYAKYSSLRALNHILKEKDNINFDLVPSCIFSFPEIASVGISEDYYKDNDLPYEVYKTVYQSNGKAFSANETDGFVKIVAYEGIITGAAIIGYDASTLIHEMAIVITKKMSVLEFKDVIHAHPTLSELFNEGL
ncbi:MAG: dihydrolipoyl dehydrogenase [Bacilli bacterium]|jgi:dihydrolipoamide dehydrogenase|nr:dihydrolipoyl dehydrogenase [Bacilli bacterium]MDD2681736.1 dihydrolipoyl dehydrogenase [Bacilli bacterium]MDD3121016.1 dihydrolipoyl dehydrogenase [Bacilli bacterium]MDD4063190.1 dihydrolipoyl dehydrogenase [Bacilli bacterium]MDD4481830.1 dihydrolipoyl dehydrogenase [Bacilli bacterium]